MSSKDTCGALAPEYRQQEIEALFRRDLCLDQCQVVFCRFETTNPLKGN
jgi:hypothetical protein